MEKPNWQTLRDKLTTRAQDMTSTAFSNSLSPEEYREITSFWGSTPEFWDAAQVLKAQGFRPE